jgi:hypothetical protein
MSDWTYATDGCDRTPRYVGAAVSVGVVGLNGPGRTDSHRVSATNCDQTIKGRGKSVGDHCAAIDEASACGLTPSRASQVTDVPARFAIAQTSSPAQPGAAARARNGYSRPGQRSLRYRRGNCPRGH